MSVVIVGGGLAGGAAAALLARAGHRPLLLEKSADEHDKVCGEFLSPEAGRYLARLGLDLAWLGASPIRSVRLCTTHRTVEAKLPFTALGVTRRRLDAALLDHAARLGATVARGVAARAIDGRTVDTGVGAIAASRLVLASGKHDVRGVKRSTRGTIDGLIGFKRYFRPSPVQRRALHGWIEVVLFEGGYAGLQLVEDGVANLCLLIEARRYAELGSWEALFEWLLAEPQLARRLGDAEPLGDRPLSVARVPYGFVHRGDGDVYRLGDQAGVIPSFVGDGMAIALHSAWLAARAIDEGAEPAAFQARLRADIAGQIRLAAALQRVGATRLGQAAVVHGLRMLPGAMRFIAALTRVPEPALRRAGLAA